MIGTSASLKKGDLLSLRQLFYGMMLPSGNDAATLLSEIIGLMIMNERLSQKNSLALSLKLSSKSKAQEYFVNEMNRKCRYLHLKDTFYTNPHGMDENHNRSSALDQAYLAVASLSHALIREISACPRFECEVKNKSSCATRLYRWNNTNTLLKHP